MINKLKYCCTSLIFTSLLFFAIQCTAQDIPIPRQPYPPRLVNDFANMMTPAQQAQLEEKLEGFERATSNQIAVVTIESLGGYDVSDYAIKLGKAWGVGRSGRDNGVVIL